MRPLAQPTTTTFTLSWPPATDPTTPSSQLVYEIFQSATSGGEDYAQPTATTPPGVSTYTLDENHAGPAYFVVRARDTAGLSDDNTIERAAVDSCTGGAN